MKTSWEIRAHKDFKYWHRYHIRTTVLNSHRPIASIKPLRDRSQSCNKTSVLELMITNKLLKVTILTSLIRMSRSSTNQTQNKILNRRHQISLKWSKGTPKSKLFRIGSIYQIIIWSINYSRAIKLKYFNKGHNIFKYLNLINILRY